MTYLDIQMVSRLIEKKHVWPLQTQCSERHTRLLTSREGTNDLQTEHDGVSERHQRSR